MRKSAIVILCLALGILLFVVNLWRQSTEGPSYKGRSLYRWLQQLISNMSVDRAQRDEAFQAVLAIGTNSIPYLLRWIQQEPPSWGLAAFQKLPNSFARHPSGRILINGFGYKRADEAILAFGLLGTNAASAVPRLAQMMKDNTRPKTAMRALRALSNIGPPALPHVSAALADTNRPNRFIICSMLRFMALQSETNSCLPPLLVALNDPERSVRRAATNALMEIAPEVLTNAPAQ